MASPSAQPNIPRALALLSEETNPAADAAIAEALPFLDDEAQSAAVSILAQRGRAVGTAAVVRLFANASPCLQTKVLSCIRSLSAGIRRAFESDRFEDRRSAIELIVRGADGQHVFLLAGALRSKCPRTRETAGRGLLRLAQALHDRRMGGMGNGPLARASHRKSTGKRVGRCHPPDGIPASRYLADELTEALAHGLATWEIHKRMEIIQAALYLIDRLEPAIRKKLADRHSCIVRPLERLLDGASDPMVAGLAFRALAWPGLQSAAGRAIERAGDAAFIRVLLADGFLLGDPRVQAGCRYIRGMPWLESGMEVLSTLEEREVEAAVRLFAASGVRADAKVAVYRNWLHLHDRAETGTVLGGRRPLPNGRGTDWRRRITPADVDVEVVQRTVVWQLIQDRSGATTDLLADFAGRHRGPLGELAAVEVRRRRGHDERESAGRPRPGLVGTAESAVGDAFDQYWAALGRLTPEEEAALTESLRPLADQLLVFIRSKLAGSDAEDRFKSLGIVSAMNLAGAIPEQIYRLCHDADPRVRSFAVTQLAALSGATTRRILRGAVNDPDQRVQANAIEAWERIARDDAIGFAAPKMRSSSHRVRANAIKCLLGARSELAGTALLDMLGADSPAHRLSALWVVERLRWTPAANRLSGMAEADRDPRVQRRASGVLQVLADGVRTWKRPTLPGMGHVERPHVGATS